MTDLFTRQSTPDDGLLLLLLCVVAYRLYHWLWKSTRQAHFTVARPTGAKPVGWLGLAGMIAAIALPLTALTMSGITSLSVQVAWALLGLGTLVLIPLEIQLVRLGSAAQRPTAAMLAREWWLVAAVVAFIARLFLDSKRNVDEEQEREQEALEFELIAPDPNDPYWVHPNGGNAYRYGQLLNSKWDTCRPLK